MSARLVRPFGRHAGDTGADPPSRCVTSRGPTVIWGESAGRWPTVGRPSRPNPSANPVGGVGRRTCSCSRPTRAPAHPLVVPCTGYRPPRACPWPARPNWVPDPGPIAVCDARTAPGPAAPVCSGSRRTTRHRCGSPASPVGGRGRSRIAAGTPVATPKNDGHQHAYRPGRMDHYPRNSRVIASHSRQRIETTPYRPVKRPARRISPGGSR
jgi:hypothetical protein